MEKLKIGDVINRLRKKKGLTQEQLANFVGVSTPAVSKWESNISYPDITLLPTLARLFSVTIDEILNYNIILTKCEEEDILTKCQEKLNNNDENAIEECMKYIIKYPLNYKLKLQIATFINMLYGAVNGEETIKKAHEITLPIFEEIAENCREKEIIEAAIVELGAAYMGYKEYDRALEMFKKIQKSMIDTNNFIAMIYKEQGNVKEGKKLLQQSLIVKISEVLSTISGIGILYAKENIETAERYMNLLSEVTNVLKKEGYPDPLVNKELHLAQVYAENNDVERCINQWRKISEIKEINDSGNIDYSKIWFLSELQIESNNEFEFSFAKTLLGVLESSDYELIHSHKDYKVICNKIKEKI